MTDSARHPAWPAANEATAATIQTGAHYRLCVLTMSESVSTTLIASSLVIFE